MKKSLVLAMTMALGVTASAYAANPFSDVPAGHWAYDSISKLAAAGVIEGYGDDTFRGDRLMTRYEMAQIVAKAMAKGANVDKLMAEFADELDALGVRVTALEKKSDNVKITGQFRWHYASVRGDQRAHDHNLRSRIWFNGTVNDNWTYTGMLQNNHQVGQGAGVGDEANEGTSFQRAYLDGRIGGVKVRAGRHDFQLVDANLYDTRMDGIKISYGDKFKVGAYYGKPTNGAGDLDYRARVPKEEVKYDNFWGANIGYEAGKWAFNVAYDKFQDGKYADGTDAVGFKNDGVFSVQAKYSVGKLALDAIYMKSDVDAKFVKDGVAKDVNTHGVIVTAAYGGAENAKVGSWGILGKYYNQGAGTFIAHTSDGDPAQFVNEGFCGYSIGADYTVAKNIVAGIAYYDFKGRETKDKRRTLWTQMTFAF